MTPEEQNPLSRFQSYDIKHVIIGFRFSEDACMFDIKGDVGVTGSTVTGPNCKGPGIVVINELEDPTFVMYSAETVWDYFSAASATTGSYVGYMNIQDRVGMLFAQRLRKYCEQLGMALGHITFAWKTFYIGNLPDGSKEIVTANPMIFHITDFMQSLSALDGRTYIMTFVSSYNTFGQLPQFSKMFQTTLTHADGNAQKEIPGANSAGSGLVSREEEDRIKEAARKARQDKTKPMKNLQDVFDALQTEMTEQSYPHKTQIQEWQTTIRDDYTKKLIPPKQYLPELPIKYTVKLEDKFTSYKIDNRNLPFEQPEQDQRLEGIRSIPFHVGTDMPTAIDTLMLMSKSVGKDYQGASPQGYRSTVTVLRGCSGAYNVHTNINSYKIPINRVDGPDTGPGDGVIGGPLEYVYQDSEHKGRDIISILYRSNVTPLQRNLEEATEGADDIGVVYGNREPISIQRMPQVGDDFFTSGYAGNRGAVGLLDINGLESADTASVIKSNLVPSLVKQTTSYNIKIVGNPYIINDLNRNPMDVREGLGQNVGKKPRWTYILYDKPEYIPMYLKLTVYMRPEGMLSGETDVDQTYFYSGYLHITRVTTSYVMSSFTQMIEGVRTEDSI
ncbi:predicted ORF [Xanthomonas phage XacN1]|nr:predicted ORF [Xanthomonas phage XacN1]